MSGLKKTALVLSAIGALNWGLVAISPDYELIGLFTGGMDTLIAKIVYSIIALCGIFAIISAFKE